MNQTSKGKPLIHVAHHAQNAIVQSWTEREASYFIAQLGFEIVEEARAATVHLIADHPATWRCTAWKVFPMLNAPALSSLPCPHILFTLTALQAIS